MIEALTRNIILFYKTFESNMSTFRQDRAIKQAFSKSASTFDVGLILNIDFKKAAVFFVGLFVSILALYLAGNEKPPVSKNIVFSDFKKVKPITDIIKDEPKEIVMKSELFSGNKYVLLASKKDKELFVLKNHDNGSLKVVEKYTASFGKLSGDKNREGDLRTPEGFYKIIKFKPKRELSEIFGPMAFVLNYPNDLDKKSGKTGSNIWIHGTGMDKVTPDTKGCVEISDPDIINLSKYIDIETETPIIIFPEKYTVKEKFTDNIIAESFIRDVLFGEAKI